MKNAIKYGRIFLVFIVIANIAVLRYKVALLTEKITKLDSKLTSWDGDWLDQINQILSIAANLRTGLNDDMAPAKLLAEKAELLDALSKGDDTEALTEAADIAYFAIKSIDWAARQIGVEIETLLAVSIAKYQSRMLFGKDKDLEAKACLNVVKELA